MAYATGFSSGALMSYTLACTRADVFAAIAPVAGLLPVSPCEPSSEVGVIAFHGTEDVRVPHESGLASAETFAEIGGCDPDPEQTFAQGDATCVT